MALWLLFVACHNFWHSPFLASGYFVGFDFGRHSLYLGLLWLLWLCKAAFVLWVITGLFLLLASLLIADAWRALSLSPSLKPRIPLVFRWFRDRDAWKMIAPSCLLDPCVCLCLQHPYTQRFFHAASKLVLEYITQCVYTIYIVVRGWRNTIIILHQGLIDSKGGEGM